MSDSQLEQIIRRELQALAAARGITQFARESGIPQSTLDGIARGADPKLSTAGKLVAALGLSVVSRPTRPKRKKRHTKRGTDS